MATLAVVALPAGAQPATAASTTGATASSSATVRTDGQPLVSRAGPGRSFAGVSLYTVGSTVTLTCLVRSDAVKGPAGSTTAWYRVTGGGFVSGAFVSGVGTLPACPVTAIATATSAPKMAASNVIVRATIEQAIAYATTRVGAVRDVGWCLKFVANAYGFTGAGYQSAWYNYTVFKRWNMVATSGAPPRGALVWYGPGPLAQGHVAISLGDGRIVSTTSNGHAVGIQPLAYRPDYKGWSYATFPNGY